MKLSDLKNGAIVELRNGERCIKVDITLICIPRKEKYCDYMKLDLYREDMTYPREDSYDIVKVNNNVSKNNGYCNMALADVLDSNIWDWKRTDEILTKEERNQLNHLLEAVKPCKAEHFMKKFGGVTCGEWIFLLTNGDYVKEEGLNLPSFKTGTRFKGMERNRQYTPEELGLEEK